MFSDAPKVGREVGEGGRLGGGVGGEETVEADGSSLSLELDVRQLVTLKMKRK